MLLHVDYLRIVDQLDGLFNNDFSLMTNELYSLRLLHIFDFIS